ncbi:hypothetical protein [Rheinheimera texasensis]|uniref:hypothetical protein n=1 Tax=Rheinheimera texasensis TaxID=306205 RepID=UPI0032B12847
MQPIKFNGKYLGGLFRGLRQDGNKTDQKNNPVMVLLLQTEQIKEVLGLEQKSTVIEKVRVPQFLIEKGALNDFADYLDLEILLPINERDWEMKGREGDMMRGVTLTLASEYKTFLALTNNKPLPGGPKKEPF